MRAITETELREMYKKSQFSSFNLPEGCRLTPAAAQFLSERRIKVVNVPGSAPDAASEQKTEAGTKRVYSRDEFGNEKPEHMTHLGANSLMVLKSHPRIKFRGRLDTFEALLITSIIDMEGIGYRDLGRDLREILGYVRQIMRAEVKEEPLEDIDFYGWSLEEIRKRSHEPQKYYGVNHLLPDPGHGAVVARLNYLRTQVREVELAAIDAFCTSPQQVERKDIIRALNRLSSLFYVLTVQLIAGNYRVGG